MTLERKIDILNRLKKRLTFAKKNWHSAFLCIHADLMKVNNEINEDEHQWLINLIEENRPKSKGRSDAYWPSTDFESRLDFINKLKEELK